MERLPLVGRASDDSQAWVAYVPFAGLCGVVSGDEPAGARPRALSCK
jgi:hypothetical protein